MDRFRASKSSFSTSTTLKSLRFVTLFYNLRIWQNLMYFERKNDLRCLFGPFLALIEHMLRPAKKLFSKLSKTAYYLYVMTLYHNQQDGENQCISYV